MEILDENSAAAVVYRVRFLVDLKNRLDEGTGPSDEFFQVARRLQDRLKRLPDDLRLPAIDDVLSLMHARHIAESKAALEIATLKQQLRDAQRVH
jgi:hypothetical protein